MRLVFLILFVPIFSFSQLQEIYFTGYNTVPKDICLEKGIVETHIISSSVIMDKSHGPYISTIHKYQNGVIIKELAFLGMENSDSSADLVIEFFYGDKGQITSEAWRWIGLQSNLYLYQFDYSGLGRLKNATGFYAEDGSKFETSKIKYNLLGRIRKMDKNGTVWKFKKKKGNLHAYNTKGDLVGIYEDGKPKMLYSEYMQQFTYYFFEDGRVTEAVVKDSTDNLIQKSVYSYKDELLYQVETEFFQAEETSVDTYQYFRLNEDGEIEEIQY